MIPLRRAFIVKQHGKLDLSRRNGLCRGAGRRRKGRRDGPDGVRRLRHRRRPQVPHRGEQAVGGRAAREPVRRDGDGQVHGLKGAEIGGELSPELLGVGYLIGPRSRLPDDGGGRPVVFRAGPADRHLRREARRCRSLADGKKLIKQHGAPDDLQGELTCATSAPARWRRAASSACAGPCR